MCFLNNLQSYWLKSLHPIVWWILRAICWSFLTRAGSLSSSMNLQHNTLVCRFIILAGIIIAHILLIIPILVSKPGCCLRILLKLVIGARELVCVSPDVVSSHLVRCTYLSTYHRPKLSKCYIHPSRLSLVTLYSMQPSACTLVVADTLVF